MCCLGKGEKGVLLAPRTHMEGLHKCNNAWVLFSRCPSRSDHVNEQQPECHHAIWVTAEKRSCRSCRIANVGMQIKLRGGKVFMAMDQPPT